ncbi:orotidine-5'-phosphate decarboxylase [Cellulosilyticum ruminicola]|uniref:orotidine-5'-phosphate decarboxylase n=1 Tax=Cellulosilyticum ruminicola TaxID=425254 RepID=UPI0006D0C0F0|nr:orotidine-5'-phosphate decarboxylase [Cellulosilyticum ruminicola]
MIDRLIKKIKEVQNPTVVGLDPTYAMIPSFIKEEMLETYGKTPKAVAEMFLKFNKSILDEVAPLIPAVKPQVAMYEQYGLEGLRAYIETIEYAKSKGLIVIGDVKRGDIASTAAAYAGHIAGVEIEDMHFDLWQEDAVTLNPYMGFDGIEPFIAACNKYDRGLFILVKTSNPSGIEIQDLQVEGVPVYDKAADLVSKWGEMTMGTMGYSRIGAVVGATYKEQGMELRKRMPHTFFLVPGYGAQGGKAEDLKDYFDKDGNGIIVNSSRGIIAAYKKDAEVTEKEFAIASKKAVIAMRDDLQGVMR